MDVVPATPQSHQPLLLLCPLTHNWAVSMVRERRPAAMLKPFPWEFTRTEPERGLLGTPLFRALRWAVRCLRAGFSKVLEHCGVVMEILRRAESPALGKKGRASGLQAESGTRGPPGGARGKGIYSAGLEWYYAMDLMVWDEEEEVVDGEEEEDVWDKEVEEDIWEEEDEEEVVDEEDIWDEEEEDEEDIWDDEEEDEEDIWDEEEDEDDVWEEEDEEDVCDGEEEVFDEEEEILPPYVETMESDDAPGEVGELDLCDWLEWECVEEEEELPSDRGQSAACRNSPTGLNSEGELSESDWSDEDDEGNDDDDDEEWDECDGSSEVDLELWESFPCSSDPSNPFRPSPPAERRKVPETDELSLTGSLHSAEEELENEGERENEGDVAPQPEKKAGKKVRFSEVTEVRPLVDWAIASRAARDGSCWLEMARDRHRFGRRVQTASDIISPFLQADHRARVWERFQLT